jgi:hypothetical protein
MFNPMAFGKGMKKLKMVDHFGGNHLLRGGYHEKVKLAVSSFLVIAPGYHVECGKEQDDPEQGIPDLRILDALEALVYHIVGGNNVQQHTEPNLTVLIVDKELLLYERLDRAQNPVKSPFYR